MTSPAAAPRVLVVDDEASLRTALARMVSVEGYEPLQAASAAEARALMDEHDEVVAVLCDIQMPGESGLELIASLAEDRPQVALVMTTGIDDPQVARTAYDLGADAYLVKPFTSNELLISLTNAVRRRRTELLRQDHLRGLERTVSKLQTMTALLGGLDTQEEVDDEDLVERLSRAVSARDEETGWHLERMSRYSARLAAAAGYEQHSPEHVRLATALHDVGKIGVADTVLRKPGPLSADERLAMQRHPLIGFQLLAGARSPLLMTAADAALCHHEWWDGGGYPRGLAGPDIPEIARIAAVADVYDALTSHRVYRVGIPPEEALEIMLAARGTQFEPRLLDHFVAIADEIAEIRAAYPDGRESESRIRVLLVDDHEIFAESLLRLLTAQPTLHVVGSAGTVGGALSAVAQHRPDVVLMDFDLPDGNGVAATERLRLLYPQVRVVMLTGSSDHSVFARAVAAGCAGFVAKTEGIERLKTAIRAAYDGEELTAVADLPLVMQRLTPSRRGLGSDLGARELEVLRLVATGLPNKLVARQLGISLNTVRNHVQSILFKLDAHSRLEAVATAVREGIVDWENTSAG